jgi:hypothetical protein
LSTSFSFPKTKGILITSTDPLKTSGYFIYLQVQQFYILPTERISLLHVDIRNKTGNVRITETRSRNHCCRGEAIGIIHFSVFECVCGHMSVHGRGCVLARL